MEQLLERCCGLDVHQQTVVACIRFPGAPGEREQCVETFGTTTSDLLALKDWMSSFGVTQVAMESTGVYWKPVYYILEDAFKVLLVNAAHIKNVPGRKTDVKDCAWIAQLLEHGLLRESFVPPPPIRELRDLTRYRKSLIQDRANEVNRLHKVLEDAGIKLASVATDILGVSGRTMLEALMKGTTDKEVLAELAKGRLRSKLAPLRKALEGHFKEHHSFLADRILVHLNCLDDSISALTQRIGEKLLPFADAVNPLVTIPGVARKTAEVIIAEIGADMNRFPSAQHLASWAGMCPGNHESAGKHKSGKTREGNRWLRLALIESAQAASHTKNTYLSAQYRKIRQRAGHKKAIVAVGHSILVIAYHLIKRKTVYKDLGSNYFVQRNRQSVVRRCVKQLAELGHQVTLMPMPLTA